MKKITLSVVYSLAAMSLFAQEPALKPEQTEFYEPVPKIITPAAKMGDAPSDAIILFDGKNLDNWVSDADGSGVKWKLSDRGVLVKESTEGGAPAQWVVSDGVMTVKPKTGNIKTKQKFGDCQLHIEWRSPIEPDTKKGQGKGNSGVFFQDMYEVQILNGYQNTTYTNGQAGSIYKQTPPMANVCSKMGDWNVYDIVYIAPRFRKNGSVESPAYITVFHNGVIIQNRTEVQGTTEYIGAPKYIPHGKGSIKLQDHSNEVSFRNIWIREL
jgi:Domain of Unknown Function (DUF1080)